MLVVELWRDHGRERGGPESHCGRRVLSRCRTETASYRLKTYRSPRVHADLDARGERVVRKLSSE